MEIDKSRPMPSHWVGYVAVDNIKAAAGRVPGAGGKVAHPPTVIPNVGQFAVIVDPLGATFCLFQGEHSDASPEWAIPSGPGTVAWNELLTTDPPAAARFYKEICGWAAREEDMGSTGKYWIFSHGGKDCAGMMKMPPEAQAAPAWLPYFQVVDVDGSTKKTVELGGKIHLKPTDIPNIGRFAVTADATGATVALYKPA
jgi:predicted enzyme related to lactoylglutathione lyase